jgi:hypothetical protein
VLSASSWLDRADGEHGAVPVTPESFPWVRWRLVADLHARAYHDAGVEVTPGPVGVGGDELAARYVIATPYCRQGNRILGALSWGGPWMAWAVAEPAPSWPEFRRRAFESLGVDTWATRRHLGCFHRRGKARHDLVFEVAVALRAAALDFASGALWALDRAGGHDDRFLALVEAAGATVPPDRPARYLAVECCGRPLTALRSDGLAVTSGGTVDIAALWWRGDGPTQLARAVAAAAGHDHGGPPR